ncbi:MAG TPA: TM1812 family CRISPR-associated protein [Candidatus Nanoarchaeia archaeon]|nr:TM1812 family CRISPR-associated protein [Candidatus Nanoarchaeia archaeon]
MSWFGKKEVGNKKENATSLKLPELPKLPDLPRMSDDFLMDRNNLSRLPTYPKNDLGNDFSKNAIKDAVSGRKESDGEFADDFSYNEKMMRSPQKKLAVEMPLQRMEKNFNNQKFREQKNFRREGFVKEAEPIFVRLDKFEESLEIFEDAKKRISEIERTLSEIKKIKDRQEEELSDWEKEINDIKHKFEKIDREIFSRI